MMMPSNRDPAISTPLIEDQNNTRHIALEEVSRVVQGIHSLQNQKEIIDFLIHQLPLSDTSPASIAQTYYLLAERYQAPIYLALAEALLSDLSLGECAEIRGDCCVLRGQLECCEDAIVRGIHAYHQNSRVAKWKIGAAYMALYLISGEVKELDQAWKCLEQTAAEGETLPRFWYHYGVCAFHYGKVHQNHTLIRRSIMYMERGAGDWRKERVWSELLENVSAWVQMTFRIEDVERANQWFEEGVIACPRHTNLWLIWGTMLFRCGWVLQSIKLLEAAFDKVSALALKKEASSSKQILLSEILGAIALLTDHGPCLYLAERQIKKENKNQEETKEAQAFLSFIRASYFNDSKSYSEVSDIYQKLDSKNLFARHVYAILYWEWGKSMEQPRLLQKSRQLLQALRREAPIASIYHFQYAWLLYDLYLMNRYQDHAICILEESLWILKNKDELWANSMHLWIRAQVQGEYGFRQKNLDLVQDAIKITTQLFREHGLEVRVVIHHAVLLKYQGMLQKDRSSIEEALSVLLSLQKKEAEQGNVWLAIGDLYTELFVLHSSPIDWAAAKNAFLRAAQLACKQADYKLACLYALNEELDSVYLHLKRAQKRNELPMIEQMQYDPNLENARAMPWFIEFLGGL